MVSASWQATMVTTFGSGHFTILTLHARVPCSAICSKTCPLVGSEPCKPLGDMLTHFRGGVTQAPLDQSQGCSCVRVLTAITLAGCDGAGS